MSCVCDCMYTPVNARVDSYLYVPGALYVCVHIRTYGWWPVMRGRDDTLSP